MYPARLLARHLRAYRRPHPLALTPHSAPRQISATVIRPNTQNEYKDDQMWERDLDKKPWLKMVAAGSVISLSVGAYFIMKQDSEEKKKAESADSSTESANENGDEAQDTGPKRVSFHDQRVMAYENRLRMYSTPDKLFRLFATLNIQMEDGDSTIFMTPDDFIRSLTPGVIQPEGLGLDKFRNLTIQQWQGRCVEEMKLREDSVFTRMGNYGLISFSDYLFLLTLLATPARQFEIAFKMFDLDGNGQVDVKEFEMVQQVILSSTAVGARHRDHKTTGNVAGSVADTLVQHFFGPNKDHLLTVDKFRDFYSHFRKDVLQLEFERYDVQDGRISEYDFARFIMSYSQVNDQGKKKYLSRIKKAYTKELTDESPGIRFEDVVAISALIQSIQDVETALSMYLAAGASITASDLKDVAKAVADIHLSDHLVAVMIALFDDDGDGNLSHREFIKVLRSRASRGLNKPKELGVARLIGSIGACTSKTAKDYIGIKS